MSLDRKSARQCNEHSAEAQDQNQMFLCLSPENLSVSNQHLNQDRRHELITRTSTESRDTDSSSGSRSARKKKHRRSHSPNRAKWSPNSSPRRGRISPDVDERSPRRTRKHDKESPGGRSKHSHKDSESRSSSHEPHRKRGHRKRVRALEEGNAEGEEVRSKATCIVVVISSTIIIIAVLLVVVSLYFTPHIDDISLYCCNNTEDLLSTLPKN